MIDRRGFLKVLGAGAVGLAGARFADGEPNGQERPNIVYILADDMGYGDLACQNPESRISTPNLDRMARQGVRFTDAHSPSSVGRGTRYGLLTGRYPWRAKLKGSQRCWSPSVIEPDRLTVGKMLKEHGYDTACIGKWNLGMDWPTNDGKGPICVGRTKTTDGRTNVNFTKPVANGPTAHGFDYYFGVLATHFSPYCFLENEQTVAVPTLLKKGMPGCPGPMIEGWKLEEILPALMKKAVEYIDAKGRRIDNKTFRQAKEKPFFLYIALTAPRTPIVPTTRFRGKSAAGAYGDFVQQLDHVVGRIADALARNGLAENTLTVFTSDNGSPGRDGTNLSGSTNSVHSFGHNPSHIYRGIKTDAWEGGHRVPFIAHWPGRIDPGTVSDETICHVDFMATAAAMVGYDLPDDAGEDSYNILPALRGRRTGKPIRQATVHHSGSGIFAIRQGRWKLILGKGSGGWSGKGKKDDPPMQLYNMTSDGREQKNLSEEHPDVVERLTKLLEKYRDEGRSRPMGRSLAAD